MEVEPRASRRGSFFFHQQGKPRNLAMHWRVTKRLSAVSEDGQWHIIVQMEKGGEIDFILETGWAVTRLSDGIFRIAETGEIIRTAG